MRGHFYLQALQSSVILHTGEETLCKLDYFSIGKACWVSSVSPPGSLSSLSILSFVPDADLYWLHQIFPLSSGFWLGLANGEQWQEMSEGEETKFQLLIPCCFLPQPGCPHSAEVQLLWGAHVDSTLSVFTFHYLLTSHDWSTHRWY